MIKAVAIPAGISAKASDHNLAAGAARIVEVLIDADHPILGLRLDHRAPSTLHAVETQQMRSSRHTAFDLIEVNHLQAIRCPRILGRPLSRPHRSPQGQPSNTAHTVDAYSH